MTLWPSCPPLRSPAADHNLSREGMRAAEGQGREGAAWLGAGGHGAGAGRPQGGLAVCVRPHGALWREGPRREAPIP